jgi:hypothetical protein
LDGDFVVSVPAFDTIDNGGRPAAGHRGHCSAPVTDSPA